MQSGLCLSGGGAKGAFQVGVLEYLAEHPGEFSEFQIGSGTSVGAINILGLAMTPRGPKQIEQFAEFAIHCWEKLSKTEDVWKLRFPPYAAGMWNPSIGDNSPLRRLLSDLVDFDAIVTGTECNVVAWDLLSGMGQTWNLRQAPSKETLVSYILASSSFPMAFPPERIGKALYTDGGIVDIAPTHRLIDRGCRRILAVLCRNPEVPEVLTEKDLKSTVDVGLRCLDGMESEITRGDLSQVMLWNRLVAAGLAPGRSWVDLKVIAPHKPLGNPLDFSPELTRERRHIGYEAARRVLLAT